MSTKSKTFYTQQELFLQLNSTFIGTESKIQKVRLGGTHCALANNFGTLSHYDFDLVPYK